MTIEELWRELELDAQSGGTSAWLTRHAVSNPGQPLYVAIERATLGRALLLGVPQALIPARRKWPECRGLEVFSVMLGNQPHFGVRLRDAGCADVFTTLAADVAPRVTAANTVKKAVSELLDRLNRWQQFLSAARVGLSPDAQRALWGELHVLRTHILPVFGPSETTSAWRAPTASHQDFQFARGALEVKTTSAKQPQSVRITSERQLDSTGIGALYLHVVIVDEREVAGSTTSPKGLTLPEHVAAVRASIASDSIALRQLNDGLLTGGYVDAHGPRYEGKRYSLRRETTFEVTDAFPRIIESDLAEGIGDVNYGLALAACAPFNVATTTAIGYLSSPPPLKRKSRK